MRDLEGLPIVNTKQQMLREAKFGTPMQFQSLLTTARNFSVSISLLVIEVVMASIHILKRRLDKQCHLLNQRPTAPMS